MKLSQAIHLMEGDSSGLEPALLDVEVDSFVIDSREAGAGKVFFALSQPEYRNNCFNGDFDDSTGFAAAALSDGATAAVVRRDRFEEHRETLAPFLSRLIFADDVIVAFQRLAHGVYLAWGGDVVGITGSAGKTTARELTAHVLSHSGRHVLKSIKNYNNGLGLPITVLNLAQDMSYDVAVLEMGMSTPHNEIMRLTRITPPAVAVVLNVMPVHIEHLGTIDNIRKAKQELVEGLRPGGTSVLNADDHRVAGMQSAHDGPTITFGIDQPADVMARNIRFARFGETVFDLVTPSGEAAVRFPLNGRHSIMNALAASAVGHYYGLSATEIAAALASVAPPPQRGEVLHFKAGFTVVNDTYNSNQDALLSMAQTIADGGAGATRRIVVAGEMRELGENSVEMHAETGRRLAAISGLDLLYGIAGDARHLLESAHQAGLATGEFFEDSETAAAALVKEVRPGDLILVKGSRGVRTEKVIEKLLASYELEN